MQHHEAPPAAIPSARRTSARLAPASRGPQHVVARVAGLPDLALEAEGAAEDLAAGGAGRDESSPTWPRPGPSASGVPAHRCSCARARRDRSASAACRARSARSGRAVPSRGAARRCRWPPARRWSAGSGSTPGCGAGPWPRRTGRRSRPRSPRAAATTDRTRPSCLGEGPRAVGVQASPALEHHGASTHRNRSASTVSDGRLGGRPPDQASQHVQHQHLVARATGRARSAGTQTASASSRVPMPTSPNRPGSSGSPKQTMFASRHDRRSGPEADDPHRHPDLDQRQRAPDDDRDRPGDGGAGDAHRWDQHHAQDQVDGERQERS